MHRRTCDGMSYGDDCEALYLDVYKITVDKLREWGHNVVTAIVSAACDNLGYLGWI